jgi:hypothetical protein
MFHGGSPSIRRLNELERAKATQRSMSRREILVQADAECAEAGLLVEELIRHGDYECAGTRFKAPDGCTHSIPAKASPDSFFQIPAPFYESGAGLIWACCMACGSRRLSPFALRLYVALSSEQDLLRYGGVDPRVLSFRDGRLTLGGILAGWDPTRVAGALYEIEENWLSLRRPATISTIDWHLIRWGFQPSHLGELDVELVAVKSE